MKEDNMMSYEMYEDFKETMVKAIKTELSAKHNQSTDTDLPQRIEQIVHSEQEQQRAIITQLAERLESIERSNANTHNGIDNLQTSVEAIEIPPNCCRESCSTEYRSPSNRKEYFGR